MSAWNTVRFNPMDAARGKWNIFPTSPACYVIYVNSRLVYVGQSMNIRKRMVGHYCRPTCVWMKEKQIVMKYRLSRKYGDWAMVELRLIRRLQPNLNLACA